MSEGLQVRTGVDYLVASKPKDEQAAQTVSYVAKVFDSSGECVSWKNEYEGVEICGGTGHALSRQSRYNGSADVLIRLPGRALDWIRDKNLLSESELNCTDADICRFFCENNFRATRIDVAMDTNDPEITPKLIRSLIEARYFTGRIKKAGERYDWKVDDPGSIGAERTIYLGSRASSRYMRVYNKQAEVLKSVGKDVGHLTRFELEIKGDAATRVMHHLEHYGSDAIPGIFSGWVNFKDQADDNPRLDRKRNAEWWERLVGGASPVILGLTRGASSPERTEQWMKKSVAKSLALAEEHGLFDEIQAAVENKRHRIKETEHKQWAHYAECKKKNKAAGSWGTMPEGVA